MRVLGDSHAGDGIGGTEWQAARRVRSLGVYERRLPRRVDGLETRGGK